MDPVVELPDAELVIVRALTAVLGAGYHVTWSLPQGTRFDEIIATKPIVDVTRVSGAVRYRKAYDNPVCSIEVYAKSKSSASAAMKRVRAELEALKNTVQVDAVICNTNEDSGPVTLPELNPNVTRLGVTYSFIMRPA